MERFVDCSNRVFFLFLDIFFFSEGIIFFFFKIRYIFLDFVIFGKFEFFLFFFKEKGMEEWLMGMVV